MNGRVYDPEIGRFMSVDPVFQFPENLQSLNPYSYVLNNPLSLTDPSGQFVVFVVPAVVAAYNAYSAASAVVDAAVVVSDDTATLTQKVVAVAEAAAAIADVTPGDMVKAAMTATRQGIKAAEKGAADAAKAARQGDKPMVDKATNPASDNGADNSQSPKVKAEESTTEAQGPTARSSGPYSDMQDSGSVGEGKDFTKAQKRDILAANRERNGGELKSDKSGRSLSQPAQSKKGVTPSESEAHVDHIDPKSKGGTNSFSNAQLLARDENLEKSNKTE